MKNPFKKEDDHIALLATAIGVGAVIGLSLSYLYLTDKGAAYRAQLAARFKDGVSNEVANAISKKTIIPKKAAKVITDKVVK